MPASRPATYTPTHTLRTVSLGTIWRGFRYPFLVLSVSVIPRLMGDAEYGRFALFMSLYLLLDTLTDIGSTPAFGRFVPEHEASGSPERTRRLLFGYLVWATVPAVVLALAAPALGWVGWLPDFPFWWDAALGVLLVLTRLEGTLFGFLYGLNQIARYSAKEVLRSALTFGFVAGLFVWRGLPAAILGLVANEAVMLLVAFAWTRDRFRRPFPSVRWTEFRPYLIFGLGFYVPTLLLALLQRSGNLFVQWRHGAPEQVAYYDLANQFLLLMSTFLGLIVSTLLPYLAALQTQGHHEAVDRYQRLAMTYSGVAAFLAGNTVGWFGRGGIARILGPAFLPVFPNVVLMLPAVAPSLVVVLGTNYALLRKQPAVFAVAIGLGLVGVAALAVLLVPIWGALGATLATGVGYLLASFVFYAAYRETFRRVLSDFVVTSLVAWGCVPLYDRPWGGWTAAGLWAATSAAFLLGLLLTGRITLSDARRVLQALRSETDAE